MFYEFTNGFSQNGLKGSKNIVKKYWLNRVEELQVQVDSD